MRRVFILFALLAAALAPSARAQSSVVTATITDSDSQVWFGGTYSVLFVPTPTSSVAPSWNGVLMTQAQKGPFNGVLNSSGTFSITLPDTSFIAPAGAMWAFTLCPQSSAKCTTITTPLIGPALNLSAQFSSQVVAPRFPASGTNQFGYSIVEVSQNPQPGGAFYNVTAQCLEIWSGTTFGCVGGGSNILPLNNIFTGTNQFNLPVTINSTLGVTGNATFGGNTSLSLISGTANFCGPNPMVDITCYGARSISIHTTGTGSGTALTVGSGAFINGDGIVIAKAGNAPVMNAPTGLTVTPSIAAGPTVPDGVTVAGLTGSSTYNYVLFAHDILGGATVPTSTVTISNGAAALGSVIIPISTWSLTANALTITTSSPNNFQAGTYVHVSLTGNILADGWYPASTITNASTFVINNVPQYSATTANGTGGQVATFAANLLTWTASTGGSVLTQAWDYFVCAQRPGDGALHIVGRSFPSTFYRGGDQYISTKFVDYGATLSSNPIVPWYLSDANCTAASPQNELFGTTVLAGGATTNLTLASAMPNSVTGAAVRIDSNSAFNAAGTFAASSKASVYIPTNQTFELNSASGGFSNGVNIWQAGTLTLNETLIVNASVNWFGPTGAQNATQFAFNSAPNIICNAYPCVYVGGFDLPSPGGNTFKNIQLQSSQNGLLMLVDESWGDIWDSDIFLTGSNNNDNMGIGLMIRPGAAQYRIQNSTFISGPNQNIDQTWAPLIYLAPSTTGTCCGGGGTAGPTDIDNIMVNRRGIYSLSNGGTGIERSIRQIYRQGGITPLVTVQNVQGNIAGNIEVSFGQHDTEPEPAYAWICGVGCSAGYNSVSGIAVHIGNFSPTSFSAGIDPAQITGGGNSQILNTIAAFAPGGFSPTPSPGWYFNQGSLYPFGNITMQGGPYGNNWSFIPNVPTPQLSLESGSFFANVVPGALGSTITLTTPIVNGTLCITISCGVAYNHSGTVTASLTHSVVDTGVLAGGTVTVTLTSSSVFTSATSYSCYAVDTTTPANAIKATLTSGTSVTFTGTGTDAFNYSCTGF